MNKNQVLGDYNIIKQIGQGALGAVYLAEHRFMKKQFALKVLPDDLCSDRAFIQRFEEEVGQLSMLEHPHIVKTHNISYDQGHYFLVTDCIVDNVGETTNLAHYLQDRGGRLSEEETFILLHQIADALDYAHHSKGPGKGMAHRGIKLNNILVSQRDKGLNYYLSDFGLTRIIGVGTFLTRAYQAVAESLGLAKKMTKGSVNAEKASPLHTSFQQSFNFLAPEQKNVESTYPTELQIDAYAFGVLAYYLLMGEFPEGYFDMPSARLPNLQFHWDDLLKSCMQTNPMNRPEKLLPTLDAVKEGQPTDVSHPTAETLIQQTKASTQTTPACSEPKKETYEPEDDASLRPIILSTQLERPLHDPDPAAVFRVDSSVKQYTPEEKEQSNIEPLQTEMVVVKGGTFFRGSNDGNRDEMSHHQITLDSFAIEVHPVTNEQFVRFLEVMGGVKDGNHNDIIRLKDSRINSSKGKFSIESGYIKHPVVGVTWYGGVAYAKWVGKRLPSEAEWEVAIFGGLENPLFPSGEDVEKSQANFFSSDTTAVKSYPPNGYGLYDMAGNVYEWCQDWYGYNYYETSIQEPINPKGPLQGVYRVLRGGCWKSLKEDLRCSRRHRNNPGTVNSTYGIRCAADVQ
ncbi:MAG: Serine/threonine-protein kinase pkn1 [Chlamydiae bacterium]|nr:Serine/threonine-protein kinase pkn1 [Chlamydiota bacterium]